MHLSLVAEEQENVFNGNAARLCPVPVVWTPGANIAVKIELLSLKE